MVCPSCLDTFNYIPPFQIHIQTCVESPKIGQKIQRVDQGTVNHLACTLWKGVFIKELQLRSPGRTFGTQILIYVSPEILSIFNSRI